MTTAEMTSRSGEDLSPAQEVKTAVAGFVADFKGFRDEMSNRMKQQEHRMTMLDRKTSAGHRPALANQADQEAPHQKIGRAHV